LGYIQSRYSYMSQISLLEVANKFRETHIPCDAIFCDIDYMDNFKVFTWKRDSFPDPKGMVDSLKKIGFHLYVILDPALKIEKGYKLYDEGVAGNHFARFPNGKLFTGSVWAGPSHLTDFINPITRKWWEDNLKFYTNDGITGFLNDMDEPSFLVKITPNAIQFGNKNNSLAYKQVHNVYGMQMARSTYEGVKKQTGLRPFNITRSAYSGIQRYASMWTGDNQATDMHMMMDIRMCLSMNLTGLSYVGMNVGGFVGNPTAYMPLFINHYINRSDQDEKNLQPHEPYAFDVPVRDELRKSIRYRYSLLPYLYSAFFQASENGIPILKALPYDYTFDKMVYESKYQEEFLCGNDILVAPVISTLDSAQIYLPDGLWYRNSTEEMMEGGKEINVAAPMDDLPVFIKAGAIIPMQSPIEYTSQKGDGILELNIWNGKNSNTFTYYEDDGNTFKYIDGSFYKRKIIWNPIEEIITLNKKEGNFVSKFQKMKLIFHKFSGLKDYIVVNGKKVTVTKNNNNGEALINNIDGTIFINLN
jgi:alpha-glucosidase